MCIPSFLIYLLVNLEVQFALILHIVIEDGRLTPVDYWNGVVRVDVALLEGLLVLLITTSQEETDGRARFMDLRRVSRNG